MDSMHSYSQENIENIRIDNSNFVFDKAHGRLLMPDGRAIAHRSATFICVGQLRIPEVESWAPRGDWRRWKC